VFQNLLLYWGVEPFMLTFRDDPEQTILDALARLKSRGWVEPRDHMVIVTNVLAGTRVVDTIQFREVT